MFGSYLVLSWRPMNSRLVQLFACEQLLERILIHFLHSKWQTIFHVQLWFQLVHIKYNYWQHFVCENSNSWDSFSIDIVSRFPDKVKKKDRGPSFLIHTKFLMLNFQLGLYYTIISFFFVPKISSERDYTVFLKTFSSTCKMLICRNFRKLRNL